MWSWGRNKGNKEATKKHMKKVLRYELLSSFKTQVSRNPSDKLLTLIIGDLSDPEYWNDECGILEQLQRAYSRELWNQMKVLTTQRERHWLREWAAMAGEAVWSVNQTTLVTLVEESAFGGPKHITLPVSLAANNSTQLISEF